MSPARLELLTLFRLFWAADCFRPHFFRKVFGPSDADPDSTDHPDAELDADEDSDFLFDADPDSTYHPDADPDPSSELKTRNLKKVLKYLGS
jgi:hypothetical protein